MADKLEWTTSRAHLLLLSKFEFPTPAGTYDDSDQWTHVLGEKPSQAAARFLQDGALKPAELSELIEREFWTQHLKDLCKERKLSVSGSKLKMAQRLVEADPIGMQKLVSIGDQVQLSEWGKEIVKQWRDREKATADSYEDRVRKNLAQRNFVEAVRLAEEFASQKVFSSRLGIGSGELDSSIKRDVEILSVMFTVKPAILNGLKEEAWEPIRIATAMMHLFGYGDTKKWLEPLETGIRLNCYVCAAMIYARTSTTLSLDMYSAHDLSDKLEMRLKVLTANDEYVCKECKKLARTEFTLEDCPEIPYPKCVSENGCRCGFLVNRSP